jgi:hypothetical protein
MGFQKTNAYIRKTDVYITWAQNTCTCHTGLHYKKAIHILTVYTTKFKRPTRLHEGNG